MTKGKIGLESLGLTGKQQFWNPSPAVTVELALERKEGKLAARGAFHAITAPFTGRSPNDKFTVKEPTSENNVWWGNVNRPISPEHYQALKKDMIDYLNTRDLFIRDVYACADARYRLNVRLVSESAWHTLFAHNMFIRPAREELAEFEPNFTIIHAPEFHPDPEKHGTRKPASGPTAAILVNYGERTVLIAGTRYAGEIKKSIFTALNYLLPLQGVLSMHCSANIGPEGDTALFFGLSGTGKTTLSADPNRGLIGDDEHGWSDTGTFNFEGGCYAKIIKLSAQNEPEIYSTLSQFRTVVENAVMSEDYRHFDLNSDAITENTRAAYPIYFISNHVPSGQGGHPKNIIFLTADAFGVLPPVSKLTAEQAMYYFLSGYTAKLAGTERGVTEPQATFSSCFGSVFLALHPKTYADMLGQLIEKHKCNVWLINTGWSGGPYGQGQRVAIPYTRAMVTAALNGSLANVRTETDPMFGLHVPVECPGVPAEILKPRNTWSDRGAYDQKAQELAHRFQENFKQYADKVDAKVAAAGPRT